MRTILMIFVIICSMSQTVSAADVQQEIYREIGIDRVMESVPTDIQMMLSDFDLLSGEGMEEVLRQIKDSLFETLKEQMEIIWKPAVNTFYVIILCSIISSLFPQKDYHFLILLVGSTIIIYLNLCDARSFFLDSIHVIQSMYDFSTVLLPCLAGASAFAGATLSAGVKYTAAALFMNILLNFSNTVLVPMVSLYLVCMIGDCVFGQSILGTVSNFIHWSCKTVLTGSVVLFTTYLTVMGMITGTGELLTVRIAKTTIANGLPIVGKIISDTASTLVAGAATIRNGAGVFGMLVIICMLIVPFTSVGVRYFLFKVVSKIASLYPEKRFGNLIEGISEAYGMILAMIGTGFVMLFLTVLSFMHISGVT